MYQQLNIGVFIYPIGYRRLISDNIDLNIGGMRPLHDEANIYALTYVSFPFLHLNVPPEVNAKFKLYLVPEDAPV